MTSKPDARQDAKQADEDAVARYLADNPDFFADRDELLLQMKVPHKTRGDLSLLEKQISLLQESQQKTKRQLKEFVGSAEINIEIFEKSRQLVLDLIAAKGLDELLDVLEKSFRRDFKCRACSMIVFSDPATSETEAGFNHFAHFATRVPKEAVKQAAGSLLKSKDPTLGMLRPEESEFLFREAGKEVQSAVVLTMCDDSDQQLGLLAIGSEDPQYFAADMDTLFIGFVADAVARLLPKHLSIYSQTGHSQRSQSQKKTAPRRKAEKGDENGQPD